MPRAEAPQTIRIDPEVWNKLKEHAEPFLETPNDVLRRLLGLGRESSRPSNGCGLPILEAATRVLEEAGMPMRAKDIADAMVARGYWSTNGRTPGATVGAAIYMDLKNNRDNSRFRKVRRGLFTLARR
jgi:hypothetical protein